MLTNFLKQVVKTTAKGAAKGAVKLTGAALTTGASLAWAGMKKAYRTYEEYTAEQAAAKAEETKRAAEYEEARAAREAAENTESARWNALTPEEQYKEMLQTFRKKYKIEPCDLKFRTFVCEIVYKQQDIQNKPAKVLFQELVLEVMTIEDPYNGGCHLKTAMDYYAHGGAMNEPVSNYGYRWVDLFSSSPILRNCTLQAIANLGWA